MKEKTPFTCMAFLLGFGLNEHSLFGPFSEIILDLAQRGNRFIVISRESNSTKANNLYNFPSGGQIKLIKIKQKKGIWGKICFFRDLIKHSIQESHHTKIDVIYTHIITNLAIPALFLSKIKNIPHIYWICSHWPPEIHRKTPLFQRLRTDLKITS